MTRAATPKLGAYAGLAAIALIAALVLGRAELVVVAAPFALLLGAGLALERRPAVDVRIGLDRERAIEGDEVTATIDLVGRSRVARLEVLLSLPDGIALAEGVNPAAVALGERDEKTLELRLRCERWNAYVLGDVFLRARDRAGLFRYEAIRTRSLPLRVYPKPESLRTLLPPLETQVFTGNQVSRTKGEGLEFADIRQFAPGDRMRRINWRVSARRGSLWINEHHPERNTDVIIFLDVFTEARREGSTGTLDLAVRAAATLAGRYLERKDRVGLVSFGGILHWLLPASGIVQVYRIVDSLLETEIVLNMAWKNADVLPRRTLPPKALVLALTPLLDERAVGTLLDLRARGFDVGVIEVSPVPFAAAAQGEREELGHRLWLMKREALRGRFARAGIPVAQWGEQPLAAAVEEVAAYRRLGRLARA